MHSSVQYFECDFLELLLIVGPRGRVAAGVEVEQAALADLHWLAVRLIHHEPVHEVVAHVVPHARRAVRTRRELHRERVPSLNEMATQWDKTKLYDTISDELSSTGILLYCSKLHCNTLQLVYSNAKLY